MLRCTSTTDLRRIASYLTKGSPRYNILLSIATVSALIFLVLQLTATNFPHVPTFSLSNQLLPEQVCNRVQNDDAQSPTAVANDVIPNFVHYVWILKDPTVFRLNFKIFVSAYSAHLYFRPERIYIHTDAPPDVIEHARSTGDVWTRRILALPGITFNHVQVPLTTKHGVKISHIEHKSDFLRIEALRDFGGIYMDMDAIPLRDVADLRKSGFANVVGGAVALAMKHRGFINNGVMLAKPHSILTTIWLEAAHRVFDGVWGTSVQLLTDLAYRLMAVPSEVLILHPNAFAPMSWEYSDQKRLFQPNMKIPAVKASVEGNSGAPTELRATCMDAMAYLLEREDEGKMETWEMDFSSTYILHAFDDGIEKMGGWDHEINLKYVLARQSNYARAVYPAIWDAVKEGVIPREETT